MLNYCETQDYSYAFIFSGRDENVRIASNHKSSNGVSMAIYKGLDLSVDFKDVWQIQQPNSNSLDEILQKEEFKDLIQKTISENYTEKYNNGGYYGVWSVYGDEPEYINKTFIPSCLQEIVRYLRKNVEVLPDGSGFWEANNFLKWVEPNDFFDDFTTQTGSVVSYFHLNEQKDLLNNFVHFLLGDSAINHNVVLDETDVENWVQNYINKYLDKLDE